MNDRLTETGSADGPIGTDSGPEKNRRWPTERWLLLHAIVFAFTALVWLIDEPTFSIVNGWYNAPEPLNGEVHQLVLSLAMYGQTLGIVASMTLIWLFDPKRRGRAYLLAAALVAAGIGSSTAKMLVGRDRPTDSDGKTLVHGPTKGITQSRHQSFPSGHTATAFALSLCLTRFYPQCAVMAWTLAIGVGFNRIITVRHFPSDVVAGAWIGYTLAAGVFAVGWIRQFAERLNPLLETTSLRRRLSQLPSWRNVAPAWQKYIRSVGIGGWLLAIVSLTIHWTGNRETWLWDRDEPRFATATREMIARGDWVVPTFNGELRPDKPILIYWLMRVAYTAFGDNPFSARFFSGLGGTAACLLAAWLGAQMFGRRAGLLAGWMLALSPMLIIESKLATVDAVLLALLTLCHALIWRIYEQRNGDTSRLANAFWLVLGLAVLTKGPVAIAIFGLTVLAFCLLLREFAWLRGFCALRGFGILATVVLPWVIAVQVRTDGEFLRQSLGRHVFQRSLAPLENHSGFPGYYIVSVLGLMAPWALLLPWAIFKTVRQTRTDARYAFLASWAIGTLVLFEAVRTKLVHYFLPAYPALALWIAGVLLSQRPFGLRRSRFALWLGPLLRTGGATIAATAVIAAAAVFGRDIRVAVAVVGVLFGGGLCFAGELLAKRRPRYAFWTLACTLSAAWIVVGKNLAPVVSEHRIVVELAERLRDLRADGQSIALWQFREPSLIYNLNSLVPVVDPMRTEPSFDDSIAYAQKTGGFICPMTPTEFAFMEKEPRLTVRLLDELPGMDVTGTHFRTIQLVEVKPASGIANTADSSRSTLGR